MLVQFLSYRTPYLGQAVNRAGRFNISKPNINILSSIFEQQKRYLTSRANLVDLAIIGGGAAGLSAGISARYEGISARVIEMRTDLGGSFSNTPLINNIPGFPNGISGSSLSQGASQQFVKLGGLFNSGTSIVKITKNGNSFVLQDQNGKYFEALRVILAMGVKYRKLEVAGSDRFDQKGIYYEVEDALVGQIEKEFPIIIYGGGNSAGQAAVFYQSNGAKVSIIFRGSHLEDSMSRYLIERIQRMGVMVIPNTTVTSVEGNDWISRVKIENQKTGEVGNIDTKHLFTMIGGIAPKLPELDFGKFETDTRGYVVIKGTNGGKMDFETSVEGIYAAGDITNIGAGRITLAQAQGVMAFIQAVRSIDSTVAL